MDPDLRRWKGSQGKRMNFAGQPKECVIGFDVLARSVGAIGHCHAKLLNLRTRSPLSGRFFAWYPGAKALGYDL